MSWPKLKQSPQRLVDAEVDCTQQQMSKHWLLYWPLLLQGQCQIIKCLVVDEGRVKEEDEDMNTDKLLGEDELLTAEFLDCMKPKRGKSGATSGKY